MSFLPNKSEALAPVDRFKELLALKGLFYWLCTPCGNAH
jgi:hypothetical protein